MGKLNRSQRLVILEQINRLLIMDSLGFDVAAELVQCGYQLGWTDDTPKPQHFQGDVTEEEFQQYLKLAKEKQIPVRVYKDRLRRGKDPKEAATTPYEKREQGKEEQHIRVALQNGISRNTYWWRRRRKWPPEKAATMPLVQQNETRKKKEPDPEG